MAKRGVRLDAETERELVRRDVGHTPYEIYQKLDLGPGSYAIAPSTAARRGVRNAIRKKLRR